MNTEKFRESIAIARTTRKWVTATTFVVAAGTMTIISYAMSDFSSFGFGLLWSLPIVVVAIALTVTLNSILVTTLWMLNLGRFFPRFFAHSREIAFTIGVLSISSGYFYRSRIAELPNTDTVWWLLIAFVTIIFIFGINGVVIFNQLDEH